MMTSDPEARKRHKKYRAAVRDSSVQVQAAEPESGAANTTACEFEWLGAAIETEDGFDKSWAELTDQLRERIKRDHPPLASIWDDLGPIRRREAAPQRDARHEPTPAQVERDQELEIKLAYQIAEAEQEQDPPDYNGRMTKEANLSRQREELASAMARIKAWATGDRSATAVEPRGQPAPKRRAGAKPSKREAVKAYVLETFPDGILPATVKNEAIASAVGVNEATVRRALKEMAGQITGK
jgi:hypothetical protein